VGGETNFRQPIKPNTAPRQPCAWPYAYPCPIINTQDARSVIADYQALLAEFTQEGITTGVDPQLMSQSRSTFSAQRHSNLADRFAQTACAPRITQHCTRKTFGKDHLFAALCAAEEPPHMKLNLNRNAFPGKVAQVPQVVAVHMKRKPMASRTKTFPRRCSQHHEKLAICEGPDTLDGYFFTIGNQKGLLHGRPQ